MHVRKGEQVLVITGESKGTVATVLQVMPKENKVIVEGVNKVMRHVKPSQQNPRGGRVEKEMPISASNVQPIDPETGKGTRVGVRVAENGERTRYSKRSGADMGVLKRGK